MKDNDLISREALQKTFDEECYKDCGSCKKLKYYRIDKAYHYRCGLIDDMPTAEEIEEPFITSVRNEAIEKNIPLYFFYNEETGAFEVYITETKELFEKLHCSKHLSDSEFMRIVNHYLDVYSDWKGGNK